MGWKMKKVRNLMKLNTMMVRKDDTGCPLCGGELSDGKYNLRGLKICAVCDHVFEIKKG
jgi:hypothetical protein